MLKPSGKSESASRRQAQGNGKQGAGRPQISRGRMQEQEGDQERGEAGRNGTSGNGAGGNGSGAGHHTHDSGATLHREQRGEQRGEQNEAPVRRKRISGTAAVAAAKEQIYELTSHVCESVSSLSRNREGWRVVIEVVELERIPQSTDIMASYLVEIDDEGELMNYERIQRYYRNEVSGDQ